MSGSWADAAASFLGMWTVMMAAMMLPSFAPTLWRFRQAGVLTTLVGAGYFFVWAVLGVAVFPIDMALAQAPMRWPALASAVPLATAAVVFASGMLQFTPWKARQLACCRETPGVVLPASAVEALRCGLRLGAHCVACCAGLTAVLLVLGMMDWRAMAVVTAAVTFERLAPAAWRAAQTVGLAGVVAGLWLIAQ